MGAFEADFLHFVSMSVAKIWKEAEESSSREAAAAAATEAVGSWEIREVFFESELRATEEWGWSEDLEMSFWSKAKNFPFSECIKADFFFCFYFYGSEHQQYKKNTTLLHTSI